MESFMNYDKQSNSELVKMFQAIEQCGEHIIITDNEGKIEYVNPAFEKLTGYQMQDILGKTPRILKSGIHSEEVYQKVWETILSGNVHSGITINKKKNGELYYEEKTISPIKDLQGNITNFVSTGRDISDRVKAEEAFQKSQERLTEAQRIAHLGNWEWNVQTDEVVWSAEICRIFGVPPHECKASFENFLNRTHPDDREKVQRTVETAFKQKSSFEIDLRIICLNGEEKYIRGNGEVTVDDDGEPIRMVGTVMDITERIQSIKALEKQENLYRRAIDVLEAIPYYVDYSTHAYEFMGERIKEISGYSPEEFTPRLWRSSIDKFILFDELEGLSLDESIEKFKTEKGCSWRAHYLISTRSGEKRWISNSAVQVRDENDNLIGSLGILLDITKRKKAEEQIQHLAYFDSLMNIPNRTLFNDRLDIALAQARRNNNMLAVLLIDLDRFKTVNDTFGHPAGDDLLKKVSKQLHLSVRNGDTLARMGGDEFLVLLPAIKNEQEAVTVSRRILDNLNRNSDLFKIDDFNIPVTASIGISLFPHDGTDAKTLIKNADVAMYQVKKEGKNNYRFYTNEMNAKSLERFYLESDFQRGLDNNEFVVFYQPKVDIQTRKITGMEALIRWDHRDKGLIPPFKFISLAEETGFIIPLTDWILQNTFTQIGNWTTQGFPDLTLAINISPLHFKHEELAPLIKHILDETNIDPSQIELEVTESIFLEKKDTILSIMSELKAIGVKFALDDFGTGYSSLSYLKQLPIDTLKIDQSFIRDLTDNPDSQAIAKMIISMAHSLDLKVVAEGVETEPHLDFLRSERCDIAQGYLFSKPIPANEFLTLL